MKKVTVLMVLSCPEDIDESELMESIEFGRFEKRIRCTFCQADSGVSDAAMDAGAELIENE